MQLSHFFENKLAKVETGQSVIYMIEELHILMLIGFSTKNSIQWNNL